MSAKVAVAGSTWVSIPRSAIRYGVIDLMPRSSATTVSCFSPRASTTYASAVLTSSARCGAEHGRLLQHPG